MSANRSPEEIRRQMWGRFDGGNDAHENSYQTRHDAHAREAAQENKRWSRGDIDAHTIDIAGDLGDMSEDDSMGG